MAKDKLVLVFHVFLTPKDLFRLFFTRVLKRTFDTDLPVSYQIRLKSVWRKR